MRHSPSKLTLSSPTSMSSRKDHKEARGRGSRERRRSRSSEGRRSRTKPRQDVTKDSRSSSKLKASQEKPRRSGSSRRRANAGCSPIPVLKEKNRGKDSVRERLGAMPGNPNVAALHNEGELGKINGSMEEHTLPGGKSFTATCLEFMDSVTVKAMENRRAKAKVCPLLMVCLDTGAVHTLVVYNYGTSAFLDQWNHFKDKRGRPPKVVSDQGSQLTSAGNITVINWDQVEEREAEQGTAWEFITTGNQWISSGQRSTPSPQEEKGRGNAEDVDIEQCFDVVRPCNSSKFT